MLSYTSQTAIKAIIYLALRWDQGEKVSIQEIAKQINANAHTTGKILQILVRHRLINSTKGPSGGFFINEEQLELPIFTIIETMDGKQFFKQCALGLNMCSEHHPCPIHDDYKKVR